MIASLGKGPGGRYSIASIATLVLLIYGFGRRGKTGMLYNPPVWMAHITLMLMLICRSPRCSAGGAYRDQDQTSDGAVGEDLGAGAPACQWRDVVGPAVCRLPRLGRHRISPAAAGEIPLRPFVSAKYDLMPSSSASSLWALIIWKLHEWLIGVSPLA